MTSRPSARGHDTEEDDHMRYAMRARSSLATGAVLAAALCAAVPALAAGPGESMTDKAKTAAQQVKTTVGDGWLTSKAKIALFADERVKGTQVGVETAQGIVHLRGKVDSADAQAAAVEVVRGLDGVKGVKNDLQVVAPVARKAVDASDKEITKAVEARLAQDAQLKTVDVRADAGVVILTGRVPSIGVSAKASETARQVAGVRYVKNELTYTQ